MPTDAAYGKPQAPGSGGLRAKLDANPALKWGLLAGGVLVAWYLWKRHAASTATTVDTTATTTTTPSIDPNTGLPTQAFAVDPTSGVPINPSTGQDFGQIGSASPDLSGWTTKAYNALVAAGVSGTAASGALFNLENGQPIDSTQQSILDKAFAAAGMPPGGPFQIDTSGGTTTPGGPGSDANTPPVPVPGFTWAWNGTMWVLAPISAQPGPGGTTNGKNPSGFVAPALTALQKFVNDVYANMHNPAVASQVNPANKLKAEAAVKSGQAYLPTGYTAPTGYILNPTTRILTKAPATKAA